MDQLSGTARPLGADDQFGRIETRGFAKTWQRSQSGPGATAFFSEDKTRRVVPSHPIFGVCVNGTAFSGDRGLCSGEVALLRCNRGQHAACTLMSPRSSAAGEPAPAIGPRALSHLQATVHPPSCRKWVALQRGQGPPNGYCPREGRLLKRYGVQVPQQSRGP